MTAQLRPMRAGDIDALVPLARTLFAGDPPWTAEQFASELAGVPETRWYVVAEADGQLAGYAGLMVVGETADVQALAVAASAQRQGIGRMLLGAVIDQARRSGARELFLEVRADNEAALALYVRAGFEQISRRPGYYDAGRTDALVLHCRLPGIGKRRPLIRLRPGRPVSGHRRETSDSIVVHGPVDPLPNDLHRASGARQADRFTSPGPAMGRGDSVGATGVDHATWVG
jgi:[ribosomal protein S18]-alanine N-acetyltransferase